MAAPALQNPRLFAATLAVLRSVAEAAPPAPAAGAEAARRRGVTPETARRLTDRFERHSEGLRRRALGEHFGLALPERLLTDATPVAGEGGTTDGGPGSRGRLVDDARVRTGLGGDVDERMSDGGPAGTAPATYRLTFQGMVCLRETTWDFFSNSDEAYAVTQSISIDTGGANVERTETHPYGQTAYQDVDDREERIGPIAACWQGQAFPMTLTVFAREHDYGDPNAFRDEIHQFVMAAIAALAYFYPPAAVAAALIEELKPIITDFLNWLADTDDDDIGEPAIEVFSLERFEELGSREPSPYVYTTDGQQRNTNLYGHLFTSHSGSGARYVFAFQVERDPAFKREEGPFY